MNPDDDFEPLGEDIPWHYPGERLPVRRLSKPSVGVDGDDVQEMLKGTVGAYREGETGPSMKHINKGIDINTVYHLRRRDDDPHCGNTNCGSCPGVPGRHPSSARFHAILKELGDLHDAKQSDYGRADDPFANVRATEEWGQSGWVGAMIRATDKLRRLQKVAQGGKLTNESAMDSFKDLAVYSIIAAVLFEEETLKKGAI